MRPFSSRRAAPLALPFIFASVTVSFVVASSGCGNKTDDSAATQGAYGESAANAPAASPAPAITAPVAASVPADTNTQVGSKNVTPPGPAASNGGAGTAPPLTNAPFAGGGPMMGGDPNASLSPTPDMDKKIASLQSGSDKKALAAAYADRGYARMTDEKAGPRVKYRKALEDYRVALQNDPANTKALENKDMIEKIYRDMGRPIPGEEAGSGAKK